METAGPGILVVGAGAIGAVTAGLAARAGFDVRVLTRSLSTAETIRGAGIHVTGVRGEFRIPVPAAADPADLDRTADIILLATKATSLPGVVERVAPCLAPGGVLVSLQNGICEDLIASVIGAKATIGCVVGWGATLRAPAEAEMTSRGEFVIGALDGRADPRLVAVKAVLGAVVPTSISSNIRGHLYAKLIINSCITTLGAIGGLRLGPLLASSKARALFIGIIREAWSVASATGVRVEPLAKLDFGSFLKGKSTWAALRRTVVIRLFGFKYRRLKSSSLQSLERGQKTEIDFLNGYIVEQGRIAGVPTPLNTRLVALVKEIEEGRRAIGPDNFRDVPFPGRW